MRYLLKNIVIFSITIGTIALGINLLFGENTISYIENIEIMGETYKRFDFYKYITTITSSFEDLSYLSLDLPTRQWQDINSNILQNEFWEDLGNDLAVIVNYIIMGINILCYPFKITGYVLKVVLALLGVNIYNTNSNIYWLVKFANETQHLSIPYI